jgi:hypothetical protein
MKYILAILAVVLGSRIADAEILSATFTPVAVPYQVNLSDSTAYALWGTGTNGSTDANLTGGQVGLISPALGDFSNGNPTAGRGYATPAFWNYLVDGDQVYGAIHHLTEFHSPVGEGFNLYLTPADEETVYTVWLRSAAGTGSVTVGSMATGDFFDVANLGIDEYGFLTVHAVGPLDTLVVALRSTSGEAAYNGANVLLGGVTAGVVVVPEPTMNCVFSLVALIAALYLASMANCFLPPPK